MRVTENSGVLIITTVLGTHSDKGKSNSIFGFFLFSKAQVLKGKSFIYNK